MGFFTYSRFEPSDPGIVNVTFVQKSLRFVISSLSNIIVSRQSEIQTKPKEKTNGEEAACDWSSSTFIHLDVLLLCDVIWCDALMHNAQCTCPSLLSYRDIAMHSKFTHIAHKTVSDSHRVATFSQWKFFAIDIFLAKRKKNTQKKTEDENQKKKNTQQFLFPFS